MKNVLWVAEVIIDSLSCRYSLRFRSILFFYSCSLWFCNLGVKRYSMATPATEDFCIRTVSEKVICEKAWKFLLLFFPYEMLVGYSLIRWLKDMKVCWNVPILFPGDATLVTALCIAHRCFDLWHFQ